MIAREVMPNAHYALHPLIISFVFFCWLFVEGNQCSLCSCVLIWRLSCAEFVQKKLETNVSSRNHLCCGWLLSRDVRAHPISTKGDESKALRETRRCDKPMKKQVLRRGLDDFITTSTTSLTKKIQCNHELLCCLCSWLDSGPLTKLEQIGAKDSVILSHCLFQRKVRSLLTPLKNANSAICT